MMLSLGWFCNRRAGCVPLMAWLLMWSAPFVKWATMFPPNLLLSPVVMLGPSGVRA